MPSSTPRPTWRVLLAAASPQTRRRMVAGVTLGVLGRLSLIATALAVGRAEAWAAGSLGSVAAVLFVLQRFVLASARVGSECDLYREATRALLESDVLQVPDADLQRVVFETNHQGRSLIASTLPLLFADLVVAVAAVPMVVSILPVRVLALAALGLGVVAISLLSVRRFTRELQDRVVESTQRVSDAVLLAVDGRLELVARGADDAFKRTLDGELALYARVATRAAFGTATLGRLPLLLGAGAVGIVALFDSTTRSTLGSTVLSQALLLASILPVAIGVVMGVSEVARSTPLLQPLVDLLAAPRRAEVMASGAPPPRLPAAVAFEDVTFAYAVDAACVLERISFRWQPGRALVVSGANGGGKSTLLRLLLGLRAPTRGTVRIGATDLALLDVRAFRQQIAYLPQRPYLGEAYVTVRAAMLHGRTDVTDDGIRESLDRTGVLSALLAREGDPLAVRIGELSVGQRQRIALARVVLQDSPLMVLDEPDANLDRAGVAIVVALVLALTDAGKMVAVAAHTPELSAISAVRVEIGGAV